MHALNMKSLKCQPTWGRVHHASKGRAQKSLNGMLSVMGPAMAPAVRRHMTLDVAGVAAALLSTSRHSEKTEGRCQVLVTNVAINIVRTYEDCDPKTAS
jgi:hypothetical protein